MITQAGYQLHSPSFMTLLWGYCANAMSYVYRNNQNITTPCQKAYIATLKPIGIYPNDGKTTSRKHLPKFLHPTHNGGADASSKLKTWSGDQKP